MVLPYTASFYFYMNSRHRSSEKTASSDRLTRTRGKGAISLLIAGLLTGLSFIFKQVGIFNLAFFALDELRRSAKRRAQGGLIGTIAAQAIRRLLLIAAGFALAVGSLLLWLAATGALAGFWRNAVVLGALYVGSLPRDLWIKFMIGRTGGYILFNATLWALALIATIRSIRRRRSAGGADADLPQRYSL